MSGTSGEAGSGGRYRLAPGVWVDRGAVELRAVSSRGPGGQNVNRRSTKVELRVAVGAIGLDEAGLGRLRRLAGRRVTDGDVLILTSDETRSRRRNEQGVLSRLRELVSRAATPAKVRRATSPTRGSVERRLQAKKERGEVKRLRRPPDR